MAMVGLTEGDSTRRLFADMVSSNYFDTMGVPLFRGRVFTAEEERPGSEMPVVIVSYSFWRHHGAGAMLGQPLRLNGRVFTVIGIAAEGFTGTTALISAELYIPLGVYPSIVNDFENRGHATLAARDNHALVAIARLRPGMTPAAVDAQLTGVAAAMQQAWPVENKDQALLVRPLSRLVISTSPASDQGLAVPAILLLCMAGVVLLIASLNVANMMLARGAARRKEIAIRLALGGGRRDIVRQLLAESLMLALMGGTAGLFIAWWSTELMVRSMSRLAPIDLVYQATPDLRVLGATFAFCLFSTLLFGFMPAWNLSRPDLVTDLKEGELRRNAQSRLFSRGNLLVMGQICLSLTLLTAAGLFLRSSFRAASLAPGFRVANSVVVELDPSLAGYNQVRGREIYRGLLARLRALPGVESAAIAATVPFGITANGSSIRREGSDPADPASLVYCQSNIVDEGYFQTMSIPLLRGRAFRAAEAVGRTAVVLDRLAADRLWPRGDALGKHILLHEDGAAKPREMEVVGIVGNVQQHVVGRGREPQVYFPFGEDYQSDMHIHLKVGSEAGMLQSVRREIREFDPALPVLSLQTMRQHLEASADLWIVRTGATLFTIFGAVALLLAMIGLYGIRSYTVARRTREIGIRMALGANARDTLRLVVREGAALTAIGASAGLALSFLVGKVLASMLYQVSGSDAVVFLAAPAVLGAVSLLACYIPARRASRVDPLIALRYE